MADEVVGRGIIEVVGDATQFSASMAKVAQDAGMVEKKLTDTAQAIGDTFKQAEQSTTVATTKIDGSTKRFIASVEREIATLSLSRDSYRAWEAQVKNIPQNVYAPYIAKLNEATAAQNAAAEAAKREAVAQREAAAAKQTQTNFLTSLRSQSDAIGRTQADMLELRAAQLGLAKDAAPYIARLREAEGALKTGGKALDQYGRTAGEVRNALRQVPAQITDIVVGLQSGQAPLTVLLQQGGQLKDTFGGVVPAAKALGGAVLGLVNPFTIAAVAIGTLIFGYAKGSAEADKFKTALILTGNAIGATVSDVQSYAVAIDGIIGTQAQASEALTQFISTNRVARENLQQFATVAIQVQQATGKAVIDTVKEFAELGKEPVEASRRLNEQTGFLTFAVYEQIKALKDQGRETEAANLAQRTYADALASRTAQITANLGLIERGWKLIKSATLEAGDAILSVGRQSSTAERLAQARAAEANVQARSNSLNSGFSFAGGRAQVARELAAAQQRVRDLEREETDARVRAGNRGVQVRQNAAAIEAEQVISRIRKESASNTEKLNKALGDYRTNLEKIRQVNPNSALLDPKRIAQDEANIRDQFKEPAGRKTRERAFTDDAATRRLQQLRESEASLRLELNTSEKLVGAQKELAEFNQLIADLKEKRILTADQKSLLAAQDAIRAQLQVNVGVQEQVRLRDEEAKRRKEAAEDQLKLEERIAQIQASTQEANAGRTEQFDARLSVFGKGSEAREQLASQTAIRREFQRYEDQLRKNTKPALYDSETYKKGQAAIKLALDQALADNAAYYVSLTKLQADWVLGAEQALQNYADNSANITSQIEDLFTNAFKSAEDALTTFVRTGKLDFKSLVDSILTDLARIVVRQQITAPLANYIQGGISGGNGLGGLIGTFLTAFGGGGGGGVGITNNTVGSLVSNGLGGGRAIGGPVTAGRIYPVTENGPELLNWQGRQYLMPGMSGTGNVESRPGTGARPVNVTNQFYLSGPVDRRTQSNVAADAGRGVQRALARNT